MSDKLEEQKTVRVTGDTVYAAYTKALEPIMEIGGRRLVAALELDLDNEDDKAALGGFMDLMGSMFGQHCVAFATLLQGLVKGKFTAEELKTARAVVTEVEGEDDPLLHDDMVVKAG